MFAKTKEDIEVGKSYYHMGRQEWMVRTSACINKDYCNNMIDVAGICYMFSVPRKEYCQVTIDCLLLTDDSTKQLKIDNKQLKETIILLRKEIEVSDNNFKELTKLHDEYAQDCKKIISRLRKRIDSLINGPSTSLNLYDKMTTLKKVTDNKCPKCHHEIGGCERHPQLYGATSVYQRFTGKLYDWSLNRLPSEFLICSCNKCGHEFWKDVVSNR